MGIFTFKCIPVGSNFAGDAFQCKLNIVYSGLKGTKWIADEMIIFGNSFKDHDINITNFLESSHQYGIKFEHEKIQYMQMKVIFYCTCDTHEIQGKSRELCGLS